MALSVVEPSVMTASVTVARTRVVAPPAPSDLLERPRLLARLDALVGTGIAALVAGAGSGKTSLLAAWTARQSSPVAWYTAADGDEDPAVFLAHLAAALRVLPQASVPPFPQELESFRWRAAADELLNTLAACDAATIVLDDVQRLSGEAVHEALAHCLRYLPPTTTVFLATRRTPPLRDWTGWVARGRLQILGPDDLYFEPDEVRALFQARGAPTEAAGEVRERMGGWPLGVDLLARTAARRGRIPDDPTPSGRVIPAAISASRTEEAILNAYIADEVWGDLRPDDRTFVEECCMLDPWPADVCAAVSGQRGARDILSRLEAQGLVSALGGGTWRLHQIFQDFLRARLADDAERIRGYHDRTATALTSCGQSLDAVPHFVGAGRPAAAAEILTRQGPDLLSRGGQGRLLSLCAQIDATVVAASPALLLLRGEALRRTSAFEAALASFEQATTQAAAQGDALAEARGLACQATVFVETVQPARARRLLQQAFRQTPPQAVAERALALDLMAENCVNEGRAAAALRYRRWAESLLARPTAHPPDARILLRTGQLRAARAMLQGRMEVHAGAEEHSGEAHREDILVLSYVAALQGDAATAEQAARRGLEIARATESIFTEAVAWMRLGHALQLTPNSSLDDVISCYAHALALADQTGVQRVRAEALIGLALAYAFVGDVPRSYAHATEGMAITRSAGDAWLSAWLRMAAGIAGTTGGHPSATGVLTAAREEMEACRDAFGVCVADLWLALAAQPRTGCLDRSHAACRQVADRGYAFLLDRPTLFGPRAMARSQSDGAGRGENSSDQVPAASDPTIVTPTGPPGVAVVAPAAQHVVRIQCLGPFRAWRNGVEIPARAWKREKARELFLILLTRRGTSCQKEALMELLWPDADIAAANRDFRVALHALSEALDPERPRNALARGIERRGATYTLTPGPNLEIDCVELERLVALAKCQTESSPETAAEIWRRAMDLYGGDFLEEYPYADWCVGERERLRSAYVDIAERLARHAFATGDDATALAVAHAILQRDRCWEEAWRVLMRVHVRANRTFQAARAYEECSRVLEEELGVAPSPETTALYEELGTT